MKTEAKRQHRLTRISLSLQEDGTFPQHHNSGASTICGPAQSIPIACTSASTRLTTLGFGTLYRHTAVARSSTSHYQMASTSDILEEVLKNPTQRAQLPM